MQKERKDRDEAINAENLRKGKKAAEANKSAEVHEPSKKDTLPAIEHKATHDCGPQREKILALLHEWAIAELDFLARFLNNDANSEVRYYVQKEILVFLGKLGCGLR